MLHNWYGGLSGNLLVHPNKNQILHWELRISECGSVRGIRASVPEQLCENS